MGKKIKDKERAEVFARLRKEIFGPLGLPTESGQNILHDFRYNRVAETMGIRSDSGEVIYPDNFGSDNDYSSEEGIRKATTEMARRYSTLKEADIKSPGGIRDELWKLFDPKYNPQYEAFANGELSILKDPNGSSTKVTFKNIQNILVHEASGNETAAREAAKGTLLEDMLSNPVHFAGNIQGTLEYRYIESFGYKLDPSDTAYSAQDLFHAWQLNLDPKSKFKETKSAQDARVMADIKNKAAADSAINSGTTSNTTKGASADSALNSTPSAEKPLSQAATGSPINATSTGTAESASTTKSEGGGVTSKVGELQTENILEPAPSQAININLENKPAESKPAGSASTTSSVSNTSNTTAVNDVNTTSNTTAVNDVNTTSTTGGVAGDKNIMKVENTTNQSSSSTVNESKKEKGGFLSKVGNFAKKAGAALNLPSIAELGTQAKGLFGSTGSNISSRISEIKDSFTINSNESESNSSPTSTTTNNSVNSSNTTATTAPTVSATSPNETTTNTSDILKTETQTSMNVEQKQPAVVASANPAASSTQPASTSTSTAVSNTTNSQNTSSPNTVTSNASQTTQSTAQPASNPAAGGGGADLSQLAQSIMRLERTIMSGIEVTIKDI